MAIKIKQCRGDRCVAGCGVIFSSSTRDKTTNMPAGAPRQETSRWGVNERTCWRACGLKFDGKHRPCEQLSCIARYMINTANSERPSKNKKNNLLHREKGGMQQEFSREKSRNFLEVMFLIFATCTFLSEAVASIIYE